MNILLLNTSELTGGAAVAANRLMNALNKVGVCVIMLVRDRKSDNPQVVSINNTFINTKINCGRFLWERLIIFLCNILSRKNLFQVSIANTGTDISKHLLVRKADVIHLHWINQGFLSLQDIRKLIKTGKPIVWTMHDLWSATGICHYPDKCIYFHGLCHQCPMLVEHSFVDLAKRIFKQKLTLGLSNITFVGCSEWIIREAKKSKLLQGASFISIPNPIDTSVFKKQEKVIARKYFGLPENKYLILFAAAKLSDLRKGATYLIQACNILQFKYIDQIEIVLMGNSSEELIKIFPFRVNVLGYLSDAEAIALAYSSANLFVIPSLEDNLPNTIMESMACGTPCVGFHIGGIPEMIDHKGNGYVAKYQDAEDLATGIEWVLDNNKKQELAAACVKKVHDNYTEEIVAEKYIALYNSLLKK